MLSMKIKEILFPAENRTFLGKRWMKVILLNVHLCGVCGYVGGILFDVESDLLSTYFLFATISGFTLAAVEIYSNCIWLVQNRGWMILLKVGLLPLLHLTAPYEKWGLLAIVFLSGWISHAKGNFRYYSILHRRRIDAYGDENE